MISSSKPYFKNLDALRFLAFMGVMLAHSFQIELPEMNQSEGIHQFKLWSEVGVLGVNFFFVLSGFLITYLLLNEEKQKGSFNIAGYYLRRTLRIWPLYFLIVLLSFLIIPLVMHLLGQPYTETANSFYFIFFTGNFYIISFGFPYSPILASLWTIAVEEQFYLVWPWLLKIFKRYKGVLFFAIIILNVWFRAIHYGDSRVLYFHPLSIVSDFAIGGWLAWGITGENKLPGLLKKIPVTIIAICYLAIMLIIVFYNQIFTNAFSTSVERVILGLAFGFVIFEQTFCENRIFDLSRIPGITYLGRISYGLYCFHEAGIIVSTKFLKSVNCIQTPFEYLFLMPVVALMITIVLAALSYRYFEQPFLNLKRKFELQ